ncbi:MAG: Caldesmon [Flavobacteriales bacterium]|nr:Caldesmon [Flavobacteriales bacterium]|tara:strand:+ start:30793 stop:32058 length:1266 start_codon:yes stop_codon:yes gene_type:complete
MKEQTQIKCPNCGTSIDVQDILAHQLEDEIKQKYQSKLAEAQKNTEKEKARLAQEKADFEEKKKQENELFQQRLEKQLKSDRLLIEEKLKAKLKEEQSEQFQELQKELNEKSEQVKELNRSKAEIEKLKREKLELKEAAEAEAQKKMNEMLLTEKDKIRRAEEERNELKFKELQKQLEDQKKLTEEMKRKQEQGSMQMQGEVQELAIEEWLSAQFPLDSIEEIKKGARGGDCIQVVNTRSIQNCGKIYYESKRTKDFQPAWIEKFKADMRDKGADVGILVTEAVPSDMDRMGIRDGVWICSFSEFKGLCAVIRESVIQLRMAVSSQENKGDKMHMLYDFLTSNTFRMQIEAIVEGFTQMKNDLESEKRSMQRIWKQREKQIDKVVTNTIDMYGSIKGIAGNAIQTVKALELPGAEEELELE